ncbi:hypothetical protein JHK87_018363 [Glycine soja]|nr:hypothetical protein JHK87_018363 [Glycine soja]
MMTFEKVVLDESPALHAKPGNFQRKLTRSFRNGKYVKGDSLIHIQSWLLQIPSHCLGPYITHKHQFCCLTLGLNSPPPPPGSRKKEDQRKARTKSIQDKSFTKSTRLPKYNHYTPLNVNQARLLEEAFNAKNLSQPPLAILVNSTGRLKTCRYHQNFGHTTEECVTLKDKI